jgi:hypothetical protein
MLVQYFAVQDGSFQVWHPEHGNFGFVTYPLLEAVDDSFAAPDALVGLLRVQCGYLVVFVPFPVN